jgi:hypothetical protein
VTVAVVVSLALAIGLWVRQRRWLAGFIAVIAMVFAVFDITEWFTRPASQAVG